jgi:flagellar motor switch protein FliN/FliY
MPEVIQAPTDNETQQAGNAPSAGSGTATQAHPAEFPQAPQDASSGSGGQIDILLDMDVSVAVTLGTTRIPVRRLLQLGPGSVLKLDKSVEAPAELYLKDSKFAEAEVVVVDNHFAVRITQIVKAGGTGNPA